jgi:hypothetical protein
VIDHEDLFPGHALDLMMWTHVLGRDARTFPFGTPCEHDGWEPSSDMSAAWDLVDFITSQGHDFTVDLTRPSKWRAWTNMPKGRGSEAEADSAPLAICRAALKAVTA